MEALEKPKEKRTKQSGGLHGIRSNNSSAMVDPAATQPHVRLRIKLPVSPARNSTGSMKGSRKPAAAAIHQQQEPATSDLSDHKSSDSEPHSPASEYQKFSNTSLKELRVTLDFAFLPSTRSRLYSYIVGNDYAP